MSAPLVTGIVALHLQENPDLTPTQMKAILSANARKDNQTGPTQNDDWGYGKILGTPPAWPAPAGLTATAVSSVKLNWNYNLTAQNQLGIKVLDAVTQAVYDSLPASTTWFDLIDLSTNTQYSLKVSAFNEAGASTSTAASLYTLSAPPTGYGLVSVQDTSITTQWGGNQNPAGTQYRLDYSTSGGPTSSVQGTEKSATISGLTASTTYYLRVNAINGDNILAPSTNTIVVRTLSPPPGNLTGTPQGVSSITWAWDSVDGATGYKFYTSTGGPPIETAGPALTQTELSTNTAYGGRVSVVNTGGEGAASAMATVYTAAAAPVMPRIVSVGISSVSAFWETGQNPAGTYFTLEFSADNFALVEASSRTVFSTAAALGLLPNTTWYARVKAENGNGIITTYVAGGSTVTYAALPAGFSLLQTSSTSLRAVWDRNSNPGDTQFELSLSSTNFTLAISTPMPFSADSAVALADLTGLMTGTTYYARVCARNRTGITTGFVSDSRLLLPTVVQYIDPSIPETMIFSNATLKVPAQAFSGPVTLTMDVPSGFSAPASYAAALSGVSSGIEITPDRALQPLKQLLLTLSYSAAQASGRNESEFLIARYDPVRAIWVPYPSEPNPTANQVSALIDHLSVFQVMQASPAGSLASAVLNVFPNPVHLSRGQTMKFTGLPAGASVKIYTFRGELVRELRADSSGLTQWDGENLSGRAVASEVYLALIKSGSETKTLKVMVEK
jgi:hypothetical protein